MSSEPPSLEDVKAALKAGRKLEAIKLLRRESELGLKEAKERIDAVEAEMIAQGEMPPRAKGCLGAVLLLFTGTLGAAWGVWQVG